MTTVATSESADPADSAGSTVLTFLIADVRGYTRFTAEHGDEAAARLACRFAELVEEVAERHEGQVVELRGDEALCVFPSARNALRASLTLQSALRDATEHDPSLPLQVGMGLDAGEAIPVKGGYRGGALNLAARLCSIAGTGEVFCSETVVGLARKMEGLAFADRGEVTLKGLVNPVRVIQIAREGELREEVPPLQPILATHPTNLPDEPTPFIGRGREIEQISALLRDPHVRMVTLTGPGGTGKTRLALQVGATLLHDFRDGVFFVNLAPLAEPALVPSAIAEVVGLKDEAGKGLVKPLTSYLSEKQLLLVLDNFEHLLAASPVVASLLDHCRELNILATSRIPLHLSREHEYPLPPLSVPDPAHFNTPDQLSQYESVVLFIERARAVKPEFAITNENAPAVGEICVHLDGLPLAIELAAARIKLFPPNALLERLSNRLRLLTGGAKDRPTKLQTLRGAIDWSYSLLTQEEQTLFARLSVFAGGCTFEAAEAVCNPDGAIDMLEGMNALVDQSLVHQKGDEEPRFLMLETIREYASERLTECRDAAELQRQHAKYFLAFVEARSDQFYSPAQRSWLDRLELEHNNLRAALHWCIEQRNAEMGLRLTSALWTFWYVRGHATEGRAHLAALLSLPEAAAVLAPRAQSLLGAGQLARTQGDYAAARELCEQSLMLYRALGDERGTADALLWAGFVARVQEEYDTARALLEEALALSRAIGHRFVTAASLHHLGMIAADAREDYVTAQRLLEESLALERAVGFQRFVGLVSLSLGDVARAQGDHVRAHSLLRESLTTLIAVGEKLTIHWALDTAAHLAMDEGETERAVRVAGTADQLRATSGTPSWPALQRSRERWLAAANEALGEEAFQAAWREGHAMEPEQAIAYALERNT